MVRRARAAPSSLTGSQAGPAIVFDQEIEDMFYGARQFCIRDLNGYEIYFIEERPAAPSETPRSQAIGANTIANIA